MTVDAVAVPELPGVMVVEPPPFLVVEAPGLALRVGPPQPEFVVAPDESDAIRVLVTAPPQEDGGSGERVEFKVTAGFDLHAYRLVVPRVQQPNVRHALPNFLPHANRPLWMTLHAALAGETVRVVAQGIVENDAWDWAQAPIFLGPDGTLTQQIPEAPEAVFAVQVGYPTGPDAMYLGPGPAITLTA